MIRFNFTPKTVNRILSYEYEYLFKCSNLIKDYEYLYSKYNCKINYGLFWLNKIAHSTVRLPFDEHYQCWFGYEITYNNKIVVTGDIEGYSLGESECFLYIKKHKSSFFSKQFLEVTYIDDIDDLKASLEKNFIIVKNLLFKDQ